MSLPDIAAFRHAAQVGDWVWVEDSSSLAQGGGAPPAELPDVGALFVAALREHYGAAASAVAERALDLHEDWHQPLPAVTVARAVDCAESALSLLMAQALVLRFEYSAQLLGRSFVSLCRSLGVDAHALPAERREALDQALAPFYAGRSPPTVEAIESELRRQLGAAAH